MLTKNKVLIFCFMAGLIFNGCSSNVKRADIPETANPQTELSKLDSDITAAVAKNVDVLAPKDFSEVTKHTAEAKSDLTSGKKQDVVLDEIRKAQNSLGSANALAESRQGSVPGLFEARQGALKADVLKHVELRNEFESADASVSSKADDLAALSAEKVSELQERYVNLEKRAVIARELGNAKATLNGSQKDGSAQKAPQTFKKTELSVKNAESAISTNVRNPPGFEPAVSQATADTAVLVEVTTMIRQNKNLSETAALKMVTQNHQIKKMATDMSVAASENSATQNDLRSKNQELDSEIKDRNKDLSAANAQVEIQSALEAARTQFSKEEAEAYQQGKSLVIRMKNMNFASGRSDLPAASLASLAKVSDVAKSLTAAEIKIEGHTDSLGTQSQNKVLSEKRASAVAEYFKANGFNKIEVQSEGYGFSKPIATNKSKEGRAQNRRVDIIITPESATSPESSKTLH